ncbi:MAG: type VI secretion system domain-containing protein, partial [Desulfovibrionaceae bacterium]|nr:type VI secretion system domain-containing protein [Desulfovibrionaceae bacterium]
MDARALGSSPIQGDSPAGFDAKYEPEYADVSAEIGKLGSATQAGAVNWAVIAEQGQIILEQKSKDLQIAAYVGIAWQKAGGIGGLQDAVHLFLGLLGTFWETAFPPSAKLRRRTNAFDWWHERACADVLNYGDAPALPRDVLDSLTEDLQKLDQLAGELMPDAMPLRDLLEAVRRLPVKVDAPAPAPEQSSTAASEDETKAALKDFAAAASRYAFLLHRAVPEDPLAWQVLRLALWGKVTVLPPAENGQTHIPPPDADRLAALHRMLEAGKYLNAALGGEDLFAASIFCLDAQYLIDAALEGLGGAYAEARQRVREETARFVRRLKGVEQLAFDGGMPFAGQDTLDWLDGIASPARPQPAEAFPGPQTADMQKSSDATGNAVPAAADNIMAEAERLAAADQL